MIAFAQQTILEAQRLTMGPSPDDGHDAWESVQLEVDARVGKSVKSVNVETQEAAERALNTLEWIHSDAVIYGRFKALATVGLFDFARLARARTLAWALWFVRHKQTTEEKPAAGVVSEALLTEAIALRTRMAEVARYDLDALPPAERARLETVTEERERRKIANHLLTLSEVCARNRATLSTDRKWREGDIARATSLSKEILRALGVGETSGWTERSAVLLSLLHEAYGDVRDTGRWLERERPAEAMARFPALVPPRKRGKKAGAEENDNADEEVSDEPETDETEVEAGAKDAPEGDAKRDVQSETKSEVKREVKSETKGAAKSSAKGTPKADPKANAADGRERAPEK